MTAVPNPFAGPDAALVSAIAAEIGAGLVTAIRTAAGGDLRQRVADIAVWLDAEVAA